MKTAKTISESALRQTDAADLRAAANVRANLSALRETQPWLVDQVGAVAPDVFWIFARDGSLTAMSSGERWWSGCSLPVRAAKFMFRKLDIGGPVACFLDPLHAAQARVALDLLQPRQAVIAIVPELRALSILLHCDDFAAEIGGHRLWLVTGADWPGQMHRLLTENPGLPTPMQFIRPILADPEPADRLIAPAQKVFVEINATRAERVRAIISGVRPRQSQLPRLCLIAPSMFRLWEGAGECLAHLFEVPAFRTRGIAACRFDSDDPVSASPLALAMAASKCDCVVAANVARADAPGLVREGVPWITWISSPRIPPAGAPQDCLILADGSWESNARRAGWGPAQVKTAGWPAKAVEGSNIPPTLAIIADTHPLDIPETVSSYSSHALLWEMIRDELGRDPFVLTDIEKFLGSRMLRLQIAEAGFNRALFIERLIIPAYQQGIARALAGGGIPMRLFGNGWGQLPDLGNMAEGPIERREKFERAIEEIGVLVHAWPWAHAHPIDAVGRPVIRAFGRRRQAFLSEARAVTGGSLPSTTPAGPVLSHDLILQLAGIS